MTIVDTRVMTKGDLLKEVERQIRDIDADLSIDAPSGATLNEVTQTNIETKLNRFYHSGLLKRIAELKAVDPKFKAAEDELEKVAAATGQTKDERDTEFWGMMERQNFRFSTSMAKGNPMGGRWDRALRADKALKESYKKLKDNNAKENFRRTWAKKLYKSWQEATGAEKAEQETKSTGIKGKYFGVHRIAVEEGGAHKACVPHCSTWHGALASATNG